MEELRRAAPLAIAGYNAGEGAVERWLAERGDLAMDEFMESIPYDETRNYTKRVLASYFTYSWLYGAQPVPKLPLAARPKRSEAKEAPTTTRTGGGPPRALFLLLVAAGEAGALRVDAAAAGLGVGAQVGFLRRPTATSARPAAGARSGRPCRRASTRGMPGPDSAMVWLGCEPAGMSSTASPSSGRDRHAVAERELRKADRDLGVQVGAVALEALVGLDAQDDVEIAGPAALGAGLAAAR